MANLSSMVTPLILSTFSFLLLLLILIFILFFFHSPLCFFCNPPSATLFSVTFFSPPVAPFHHHSFHLRPHLSISGLRRIESERENAAVTASNNTFVLSFSSWYTSNSAGRNTLTLLCPFPTSHVGSFSFFFFFYSCSPHTPGKSESVLYCSSSRKTCFSLLIKPPRQSL